MPERDKIKQKKQVLLVYACLQPINSSSILIPFSIFHRFQVKIYSGDVLKTTSLLPGLQFSD